MHRILILAACLLSTGALANPSLEKKTFEVFYEKQIDKLSKVYGVEYFAENQVYDQGPTCALQITGLDGSTYQVAFRVGLPNPPFTIYVKDNSWEIAGPYPKGGALQMNMFWIDNIRGGDQMRFILLTKNSIVIKKIGNKFSELFAKSNRMVFVMPDNIKNAQVIFPLDMDRTLKSLVACSHKWEDTNNE
jgi:hypothetical protein